MTQVQDFLVFLLSIVLTTFRHTEATPITCESGLDAYITSLISIEPDVTKICCTGLLPRDTQTTIPTQVGLLTKLTFLGLGNGALSGMLPNSLTNLSDLKVLDVSNNNLSGPIPFTQFPPLWNDFNFEHNLFTGPFPLIVRDAGPSKPVYVLRAGFNQFTGPLRHELITVGPTSSPSTPPIPTSSPTKAPSDPPTVIIEFRRLDSQDIAVSVNDNFESFRKLVTTPEAAVGAKQVGTIEFDSPCRSDLVVIQELPDPVVDFSYNQFTGPLPASFFYGWFRINLAHNSFTGPLKQDMIGPSAEWSELSLASNKLSGSMQVFTDEQQRHNSNADEMRAALPERFTEIDLSNNQLTGVVPMSLLSYDFTSIDLNRNQLTGTVGSQINELIRSGTRSLDFSYNQLEGEMIITAATYRVSRLWLVGNPLLDDIETDMLGFVSVGTENSFRPSNDLRIDTKKRSIDAILSYLARVAPEAQELYLGQSFNNESNALPAELALAFPALKTLDVRNNNLTGTLPLQFGRLRSLERITIHGNRLIEFEPTIDGGPVIVNNALDGVFGDVTRFQDLFCDAGMFDRFDPDESTGRSAEERCRDCPPGTYQSYVGMHECFVCPDRHFAPDNGTILCTECLDGTVTNDRTACGVCAANSELNNETGVCEKCTVPTPVSKPGLPCEACADGYVFDNSINICVACPINTIQDGISCRPCASPTFQYNPFAGETSCKLCNGTVVGSEDLEPRCAPCPTNTAFISGQGCEPCTSNTPVSFNGGACEACPAGSAFSESLAECVPCPANSFHNQITGRCDACVAPQYTSTIGNTKCTLCRGTVIVLEDDEQTIRCDACPKNTAFDLTSTSDTFCLPCPSDRPVSDVGEACTACSIGTRFSPASEMSNGGMGSESEGGCVPCGLNTYWSVLYSACGPCPQGLVTKSTGAIDVRSCVAPVGSVLVDDDEIVLLSCPTGTTCAESGLTSESVVVNEGYWRTSPSSMNMYPCPQARFCVGSVAAAEPGNSNSSSSNLCRDAHSGVFCAECIEGYARRVEGLCEECNDVNKAEDFARVAMVVGVTVSLGVIMASLSVVVLIVMTFKYGATPVAIDPNGNINGHMNSNVSIIQAKQAALNRKSSAMSKTRSLAAMVSKETVTQVQSRFSGKMRILVGFIQILVAITALFGRDFGFTYGLRISSDADNALSESSRNSTDTDSDNGGGEFFPHVFDDLADSLGWIVLSFLKSVSAGCAMNPGHSTQLLLFTVVPAVVIVIIVVVFGAGVICLRLSDALCGNKKQPLTTSAQGPVNERKRLMLKARKEVKRAGLNLVLLVLFLVYPTTSRVIFQTFDCFELDDGRMVLRDDVTIVCGSSVHTSLELYANFMVALYVVGVPTLYIALLRSRVSVQFLTRIYTDYFRWFEVEQLVIKLLQTTVIVVTFSGEKVLQLVYLLVLTVLALTVLLACKPYKRLSDNVLSVVAQGCLVIICLLGMTYNQGHRTASIIAMFLIVASLPFVVTLFACVLEAFDWRKEAVMKSQDSASSVPVTESASRDTIDMLRGISVTDVFEEEDDESKSHSELSTQQIDALAMVEELLLDSRENTSLRSKATVRHLLACLSSTASENKEPTLAMSRDSSASSAVGQHHNHNHVRFKDEEVGEEEKLGAEGGIGEGSRDMKRSAGEEVSRSLSNGHVQIDVDGSGAGRMA